ncbi:amidase [Bradyrhizobium sp. UFLA03-84]|uniref:amidase n=1 Tax=Bradyrhizobium sp. UFLA03-84 TaxID=418599 RepID=UPI000BAE2544|nr:amidase [Bradyrhizobium sp. UFLA03-84]PAY05345.1 amidase [Bradyrhizobium sp. UFLA03-84]
MERVDSDPSYWSATLQIDALRRRELSAVELLDHAVQRIERDDVYINAVVVRDFERARLAAHAADELLKLGNHHPLLGIPMTVKESFNVAGLPTTWGFAPARNCVAAEDSLPVQRLKAAGAIVIGKTNVATALSDWQSFNAAYGTTNNPWDLSRTPGGSSGGSAAALAAGFVPLEVGSDLRGSLRVPAHYCGVYGHKPTHGIIPLRGHVPPGAEAVAMKPDLAVAGPMARCPADLALAMDILAGPDEDESAGYSLVLPAARHENLRDFRILVVTEHPLVRTSSETTDAVHRIADRLRRVGASVSIETARLPDLTQTALTYTKLFLSFAAAQWPAEVYNRCKMTVAHVPPEIDEPGIRRARAAVLSHRDWVLTDQIRAGMRKRWHELFRTFDLVLCPTMPTPAFAHDHLPDPSGRRIQVDGTEIHYEDQDPWLTIASLSGLPSTVAPIGYSASGLPIGVQIIGPQMEDKTSIAFAGLIEREFGGFCVPPVKWRDVR